MKEEIKFGPVHRDMWQSFDKYQPCADRLARTAPLIIEMGCLSRVKTNGGIFGQVNPLCGENLNKTVRAFTKPFHKVSVQAHILDRDLNGLQIRSVPADARRLIYKVRHAQGVGITRIFYGLNEVRNIIPSIHYTLETGVIPQVALCITFLPMHTAEYYATIAERLAEADASKTCLEDMASVSYPEMSGRLTKTIKEWHPRIIVQYHEHSGSGLSVASILEVCENGADTIDVVMEPVLWRKVHPDVISVQAMLKDTRFQVPEIDTEACMKARAMTQGFVDDFLGYSMDPTSKHASPLFLKCGLPGGMMGSMMAGLKEVHSDIDLMLRGKSKPGLSIGDSLMVLLDEMEYVWPKLGYPPPATPFSRYMENVVLMSVMSLIERKERRTMIDNHTWGMILSENDRLLDVFAPEAITLAEEKGYGFTDEDPQRSYPGQLNEYRKETTENGWDLGQGDEELFKLAMHDCQYRNYKSSITKEYFKGDLQHAGDAALAKQGFSKEEIKWIEHAKAEPVTTMERGQVIWEIDMRSPSIPSEVKHKYDPNDVFYYIATPWYAYDKVSMNFNGRMIKVCVKQGALVGEGKPLVYIEKYGRPA